MDSNTNKNSDLVTYSRKRKRKADLNEETVAAPNQSSPPANQSNPIQQQRSRYYEWRHSVQQQVDARIQKYKDLDPQVKEWEKSLPHDEYFFPGVPTFKLTELRQRLGLETDARSRKIPKTGGRADGSPAPSSSALLIEGEDDPNYPFEHEAVCWRDGELPRTPAGQPSSVKEGVTFKLKDCLVSFDDDEGYDLVCIDSTAHVQVDSLLGKHVLLCCFHVPLYWAIDPVPYARSISSLCAELATLERENHCEIVIVAKMTPHWADNKAAFDHFSKAFPRSCLTVPFHHKKRIDRICQSLNLRSFYPLSLLVSPEGMVLRTRLEHVWRYGVEGFPFTNERLRAVEEDDKRLMSGSCSSPLATLLGNRSLRNAVTGEEIFVSALEGKVVGLYLCCKGNLLDSLSKVYRHCKDKGYSFEIVVVRFPDLTGLETSVFEQLMTDEFVSQELSWWVLPGDNSVVARRLIRISGDKLDDRMSDRLLSVGAHGKYVDPIADVIMAVWKIDDAYPFSLAALLDREVERLGNFELDSILGKIKFAIHVKEKNQSEISSEDLQAYLKGKRVFVYHTALEELTGCSFLDDNEADIWSRCKEVKDMCPDCEVLYVQSYEMEDYKWNFPDGLSLYMCPYDESLSDYLYEITSVANSLPGSSLAFGTDGHIVSLARGRHDPFAKSLREDIRYKLVSLMKGHDMNKCQARLSHLLKSYAYLGTSGV